MKIIFKNHTGAVENKSVNLCEVYAIDVAPNERQDAMASGFYSHTNNGNTSWRQARLTRINLEKFSGQNIPAYNFLLLKPTNIDRHNLIYDTYMGARNYYKHPGDREFNSEDYVIDYMDEKCAIIGYSKVSVVHDVVDLKLFCVMDNNGDITSKGTLNFELDLFKSKKLKYAYLGPSYQRSSIFKSKIKGFEWWTGEDWSINQREFHKRCLDD